MVFPFSQDFLVFFQGRSATGAISDNSVDFKIKEQIQIKCGNLAGCFTVTFGQMRGTAAFLLFGRNDIKPLMIQNLDRLA